MRKTSKEDIINWLEQIDKLGSTETVPNLQFWKPFHFATLALHALKNKVNIKLPDDQTHYAVRMGLWDAIGQKPPVQVNRNSGDGRFLPVCTIKCEQDIDENATKLKNIAKQQVEVESPDSHWDSLETVLIELLGNCYHHSNAENSIFGLVCAQSWPNGNLAQIAIADLGQGIRNSLSKNNELILKLENENACEIATYYGVTGKKEGHSGYGLTLAKDLLKNNQGNLILTSYSELFQNIDNTEYKSNALTYIWQGTLVVLEWNTNKPLDVLKVYDSWPHPEGITDEDYD